ncbi:MAG: hypothetical protein D6796_12500, partial [Caldilineae bacterium]
MNIQTQPTNPQSEDPLPETPPAWLIALLKKYGAEEEALAEAAMYIPPPVLEEGEPFGEAPSPDDISDVLADIAAAPPTGADRLATSVDWGAPPAEPEAGSAM